ncbi:MAG: hypothetical protein HY848_04305 [Betaproteobacteria bacterium]|nr:hypothetical protein [Betaproteobacteria bacterium]
MTLVNRPTHTLDKKSKGSNIFFSNDFAGGHSPAQFSAFSPGTLENSLRLCVTNGTPRLTAWAAMRVSRGPMGWLSMKSSRMSAKEVAAALAAIDESAYLLMEKWESLHGDGKLD